MKAAGRMGWGETEFHLATPRYFANVLEGFQQQQDALSRERWTIARYQAQFFLSPHLKRGKRLKATDLGAFPWEKEYTKLSPEQVQALAEDLKREAAEFFKDVRPQA
jgi:hypothetical protein